MVVVEAGIGSAESRVVRWKLGRSRGKRCWLSLPCWTVGSEHRTWLVEGWARRFLHLRFDVACCRFVVMLPRIWEPEHGRVLLHLREDASVVWLGW